MKIKRDPIFNNRLLIILILCLSSSITTISCRGTNQDSHDRATMKSVTLNELKNLPAAEPPINSGQEAISYAINFETIYSSLANVVLTADFVTWNVTSQSITKNTRHWWEVKINSSGMLPSFTCMVSFTREGELLPKELAENYCEYNK